jgi:hypothetical protein
MSPAMPLARHALSNTLLLGVGIGVGVGAVSAQSISVQSGSVQSGPSTVAPLMHKTTDTLEFCLRLADDVDHARQTSPRPDPHAQMLAIEGQRMCSAGHIISGIARLRMALTLLRPEK